MKFRYLLILLISISSIAQETPQDYSFSMEEAIKFGLENNYSSVNAQKDIEIALKQKWEIIAQGLPQVSATADYQNYLKQPVTLLPAEITGGEPGTFTPVTFGTEQNVNATATWNQLIFDGSYIVGIQSARTLLQISENAKTKTDLEIKKAVINAYGNVLLAEENVAILQKNVENVQQNYDETNEIYKNGLAEQEDVEQLEITLLNLKNNLSRSKRMRDIAYEMFNLTLGIPVEIPVSLTEELDNLAMEYFDLELLQKEIAVEENIDYRIAANTAESHEIEVKLEKSKALPSLTGFLNYGVQGFSQEFTFLNEDQEYFGQSILGVSLNIPIFSSGMRSSRTQQKQIAYEQAMVELEQTENEIKRQINSAKSDYEFSLENYQNQKKNLELAERIENKNQIKFFEGIASSFELSEAQRQLYQAQQDFLQSMLDVITAKVELENLLDTRKYNNED
ncbi:TolC family protein [Salegentibacter salarius]|uniref:Transporter n=1 Tax=Salegentibacter salarius TaxID=435906 RepID=A0A2N0TT48_9FLAO|nr:TolC family protein [Salegentibacter salarius]OEY72074.1 transporter [Salegentibacter salarius]PKD17886.1 transporter [Salegentibacter salarius]SLK05054.1 Outer membrane protein TolC [Salegentibacter salarius]